MVIQRLRALQQQDIQIRQGRALTEAAGTLSREPKSISTAARGPFPRLDGEFPPARIR
jgi:hypothetical protein